MKVTALRSSLTTLAAFALMILYANAQSISSGLLVDLLDKSSGMTVAVDSTGVTHVAAATIVQGDYRVVYGRCAGQCDRGQSWSLVALTSQSSTSYVPTIALTANGRPRILYASELGATPGFHYLECDSACDRGPSWRDVRLTTADPGANPAPRPRIPFAVSPGGAAAFAYDDGGNGMYALVCNSSCALGSSWTRLQLAGTYVFPESLAFSSDRSLQLVARHGIRDDETLLWLDCSGDCSAVANWSGLDGLWLTHGGQRAAIARTAQGGTRIVFYGDDPNTVAIERVFGYIACDSDCRNPASWKRPVLPVILRANSGDVGFGFALDAAAQPVVGILDDTASAYASCTGDCTGLAGQWQVTTGVRVSDLNSLLPPTVPSGCSSASWGMYVGPDLAIDPLGKPVLGLTGYAHGLGGQCGADSAATASDSFLFTFNRAVVTPPPPTPNSSTRPFTIVDRGGASIITDGGGDLNVGYARIQPNSGSTTPTGVAIVGTRSSDGVLFTEAGVPAAPLLTSARIYAEINGSVNTGLAIANPNSQTANITFHFATSAGVVADQTISIAANSQIAKYLNDPAFGLAAGTTLQGTFTFTSNVPVSAVALRLLRNERGEELLTTLPMTDLSAPATSGTAYLGHFADGAGSASQVILVNPTDSAITGTIQFFGQGTVAAAATPISLSTNLGTATSFSYSIPRQSSFKLTTTGTAETGISGSVRVTSASGSVLPSALVVFSFRRNNITVSEAGVPAIQGSAFRMYAETNTASGDPGSIQAGIAIANLSANPTTVNLELLTLDGAPAAPPTSVNIAGNGQIARFAHELFNMTFPFKGIIRISGGSNAGLAVVGLRLRYNERGDFLMTTTPPSSEGSAPTSAELLFPHFVNGVFSGFRYTTQFVLFSGSGGQTSNGNLRFFKNDGSALNLNVN